MSGKELHKIFILINNNNYIEAKEKLEKINIEEIKDKNGYYSLMLRVFIKFNNFNKIIEFFDNYELMSRDFITVIEYLNKFNDDQVYNFYQKYKKNFVLKTKDIDNLIKLKNKMILMDLINKPYKTSFKGENINFDKIVFSGKEYNNIIKKFYSNIDKKIINIIKKLEYNFVIDGGNVLYCNKGKLCKKSYKTLEELSSRINNNLIILNYRHKKSIEKYTNNKMNIIYTPFNINDDLYIIFASIINNSYIITNDCFGDHNAIYSNETNFLKNYFDENILNYKIENSSYFLKPPIYSHIRIKDSNIFIPSITGGFFIVKIN